MGTSLLTGVADEAAAAMHRLRAVLWPITQTSVVAALAWYLTHDLLHHQQPFFAPISAVVCMSASNVLRARRATQMMVGVALGIAVGGSVEGLLGRGYLAIGVAVFVALSVAVLSGRGVMGQGLMFVNQTAVSAVLVLVFAHSGVVVTERLFDSLIGGGLALVFAIGFFPADPQRLIAQARTGVLAAAQEALEQAASILRDPDSRTPDWPRDVSDRLHAQVGALIEARCTADLAARRAPRRWALRGLIRDVDAQAAQLGLFAGCVLHLVRSVTRPVGLKVMPAMQAAVADLAAATALADSDPAGAAARLNAARRHAAELQKEAVDSTDVLLADVLAGCAEDLHAVSQTWPETP
ncbi:FUSC family protein [Mycobacterium vicinigordonae]|uniref:Aromatic acid exporter family protein n=1 Tax=Mycobacterium vicinigordonae TaxID=1719132 RepID=A0A7D6HTB9_9MYCO|nr:FUSC family protein [Mycobacterium vicinigordonae]QLL09471.1 aromatic acid exporter family protein [Mycobacterium vicinigordonae]